MSGIARKIAVAAAVLSFSSMGSSATPEWADMARVDLAAARDLIEANHPGASAERHDAQFRKALNDGFAAASAIAAKADTYGQYRASLLRFAASFADDHIWTHEAMQSSMRWPGFFVERTDERWRVLPHEEADSLPKSGTTLLSCDGIPADELADGRVGAFVPGWSLPADKALQSPRFLIDLPESHKLLPKTCLFDEGNSAPRAITLDWQPIKSSDLNAKLSAARPSSKRQQKLEAWNRGYWVQLSALDAAAAGVAKEMEGMRDKIVDAPFVVMDLRGNGGGNSDITDRIANLIFGTAKVESAMNLEAPPIKNLDSPIWRVSNDNLATLDKYVTEFAKQGQDVSGFQGLRDSMAAALTDGKQLAYLTRDPKQADGPEPAVGKIFPAPRRTPAVYLITDYVCFSSCLLAADEFRKLGAIHLGLSTSGNTNYSEVREITLPSGLSTFSTLQAWMTGMPDRVGPYLPSRAISSDVLADDIKLRALVSEVIANRKPR